MLSRTFVCFILLLPAAARAGVITSSAAPAEAPLAVGPVEITLNLPRFDPAAGTLRGARVSLDVRVVDPSGSIINVSGAPAVSAGDALSYAVVLPGEIVAGEGGPVFALAGLAVPPGLPVPLQADAAPGGPVAGQALLIGRTDGLDDLTGPGSFALEVSGLYNLVPPRGPLVLAVSGGVVTASAAVTYDVDPPAGVPEPGTLGPAALGAAALGARAWRRRGRA